MIEFLCNECGCDFETKPEDVNRVCPVCKSKAEEHVLMSSSISNPLLSDQQEVWEA
jgi:predicted Zn-ribbon and HTH transcriptional regulator